MMLTLATAFMAMGLTTQAEARHEQSSVYVSGYRSCGTPIYTMRYWVGYDRCGRPIWRYRVLDEQRSLHAKFINADVLAIRQKYNLRPDSIILLYVGRLYKEKRIEELLQLVKRINSENLCQAFVEGVIIGDSPELTNLKENAKDNPGIHFLGAMYDQEIVAEYMRIASAMVIPGKVGLAVNHALAHGLPVITRESKLHAPEVEYIESGTNGLIIPGDFDEFVRQVVDCINSPQKLKGMSQEALETRESLSLEFMVKAFDEAVNKAIALKTDKKTSSS